MKTNKELEDYLKHKQLTGMVILLKRKPTLWNSAPLVYRTIKSIDFVKRTIDCDDSIRYKFSQVRM